MKTLPFVAEYGSALARENPSRRETLATRLSLIGGRALEVELASVSAGYVPAGSALRLQSEPCFSVRWHDGKAYQGRSFRDETEARKHFESFAPAVNIGNAKDALAAGRKAWLDIPGRGSFPLVMEGTALVPGEDDSDEIAARVLSDCRHGYPRCGSIRLSF